MKNLLIIFFVMLVIPAQAADYYVTLAGSDAAAGSAAAPFRTVQKAVDVALAGDIVNVAAGSFPERVFSKRSGTEAQPITWRGAAGAVITSAILQHARITVEGFKVTRGGSFALTSSYCIMQNCEFNPIDGVGLNNITMASGDKGNRPFNHIIRNNLLLNAKGNGVGVSLHGKNHLVEDNYYSSQNGADANWIFANDCTIRGNTFENWSNPGIAALHSDLFQAFGNNFDTAKNLTIEGNFALNCNNCQLGNVTDDKFDGMVANWTWKNNIWIRVSGPLNLYSPGHKFYNNTWVQSPLTHSSGVVVRTSTDRGNAHDTKFFNNIFYKCGQTPTNTGHGYYGMIAATGVPILGFEADYNLVIGVGAGTVKTGTWSSVGRNANGFNGVEPLFINPINPTTANEVRLLSGSPVIGLGSVLNAEFVTDYSGATRGGAWDIGAMEYDVGEVPADTTAPTLTTAVINADGDRLTLTFSENVSGVTAGHYAITGQTLGAVSSLGPVVVLSLSPLIQIGTFPLLNYTSGAGRTADEAGNLLATISNRSITNDSLETAPIPTRPSRRGRGSKAGAFSR